MADAALGKLGAAGLVAAAAKSVASFFKASQFLLHGGIAAVMAAFTRSNGLAWFERRQFAMGILAMVAMRAFKSGLMAAMGKKGGFCLVGMVKS